MIRNVKRDIQVALGYEVGFYPIQKEIRILKIFKDNSVRFTVGGYGYIFIPADNGEPGKIQRDKTIDRGGKK